MGYLNNVTGYRDDLLANRAIVKHGNFALLTPDGLVKSAALTPQKRGTLSSLRLRVPSR